MTIYINECYRCRNLVKHEHSASAIGLFEYSYYSYRYEIECKYIHNNTGPSYCLKLYIVIDGYTPEGTLDSGDTVQLGTTVILVCRVTGIPYGVETCIFWTCPNLQGPCNVGKNILKIPLISTSDGGNYTCTVLADGINKSAIFTFTAVPPSELS